MGRILMQLIGINGFKGSGKDTVFEQIKLELADNGPVRRIAFADKLKCMAMLALGYEGTAAELIEAANLLKESGVVESRYFPTRSIVSEYLSGREYLQRFGDHARQVFGESFWIDQILPEAPGYFLPNEIPNELALSERYPDTDYLVVTDVRYPNEAQRVRDLDGLVWEIKRPGVESDGHSSEKPLPEELVDLTILNDGPIEQLRRRVADNLFWTAA
jgi:hypothetical protein